MSKLEQRLKEINISIEKLKNIRWQLIGQKSLLEVLIEEENKEKKDKKDKKEN